MKLPTKKFYFKSEAISPIEMFHRNIEFANNFGKFIGSHIFSQNFSLINPVLIIMLIDLVTYLFISFQNIYAFWGDFVRVIFCVVTLGMGFQCCIKLYTFIFEREQIKKLAILTESFHENASCAKASQSFEKWILTFCRVASFMAILFYSCGFIVFFLPNYLLLNYLEKNPSFWFRYSRYGLANCAWLFFELLSPIVSNLLRYHCSFFHDLLQYIFYVEWFCTIRFSSNFIRILI